ncbi:MAG: alpha/beta hydrolase [Actinobacteria bacterium]|nr:alpha/beta hydrolase [Actinomycetota bacterium]
MPTHEPLDVAPLLDPEVKAALAQIPIDIGSIMGSLTDDSIALVPELFGATPAPPLSDAVTREWHDVPGTEGVTVRVHRPVGVDGALPCLVWMHGGGLVLGSALGDDARFDAWCARFGCVGVSVEYRLSPETPYPGPHDDCYAALTWVRDHADELGVDPDHIGIGGASAGGGLAAGVGLRARDERLPVAFQLLIYPMIDDRQITTSSAWIDPIWPPAANTYGWTAYLGATKGGPDVSPYAAAARATDLTGLPPTFVCVGALDGFSDEDIDFAVRLRHAGVPTELHVYDGAPHGFDSLLATTGVAQRCVTDMEEWLAIQFGG